jgi:hypothetical protein
VEVQTGTILLYQQKDPQDPGRPRMMGVVGHSFSIYRSHTCVLLWFVELLDVIYNRYLKACSRFLKTNSLVIFGLIGDQLKDLTLYIPAHCQNKIWPY